jgi:hypothetical protein
MSDTSHSSSSAAPSAPAPAAAGTGDSSSLPTGPAFARAVYDDYARLAVALPKRVTDSIMKFTDPVKIQQAMDHATKHQDSIARSTLADFYHISTDSLQKILDKGNRERSAKR